LYSFSFVPSVHSSNDYPILEEPKPILRAEYRLVEIPNLKVSASMMLNESFLSLENFPKDARVLKSWAFEVNDNSFSSRQPEAVVMEDLDPKGVGVLSESFLLRLSGSDRIRVKTNLSIKNLGSKDRKKKIVSEIDLVNDQSTVLSSWSEIKASKVVGYMLLVRAKSLRAPNAKGYHFSDD
jgi:hypothetical protein